MATAAAKPKTAQASKWLDKYAELYQQKLEIEDAAKQAKAPLEAEMAELKNKLEDWTGKNPDAFQGKKTLVLEGGTFGHKLGNKAVAFPLGDPEATSEEAKAAADELQAKYLKIVKVELPDAIKESVDAKVVVGAWPLFPNLVKKLLKLGISVKQENSFFITPKK